MWLLGIDDATRSNVLGSLTCAGFLVKKENLKKLRMIGVKDSKVLTRHQRDTIFEHLKKLGKYEIIYITAEMISTGRNLNDLECEAYCKIAQKLKANKILVNNFDRNRNKFIMRAERLGFKFRWDRWYLGHNNESKYLPIGAASIIAKHFSDTEYDMMKERYNFDFGAGQPNDYRTRAFIFKHLNHNPKCNNGCRWIRWNWHTIERLRKELGD